MTNVAEYKKKLVQEMVKLARQYPIIGIVNMEGLPAPQLQSMKSELRGKVRIFMTKKRFMKIALDKLKNEKKHIEELENCFEGMPALIFTSEDPFKLSRILQKSRTSAPAKAGQTAPNDIVINKGPTPFAPGPIISELSGVGLKVGVESGKVAVKEDYVIVKKGEKIKPKVAEILTRLDIKPMEVGLGLVAAYEDGIVYKKDVLQIDEEAFNEKLNNAAAYAFNLAFNIAYITKDNAGLLIAKAFNDAKALGLSREILEKGIVEDLLGKAERSMSSLKNAANIETVEKPKEEAKEKPKEEVKEEVKLSSESEKGLEKPKTFQKKQAKPEVKAEEKKIEAPIQEKIEKKEEKILEEEKNIIEEEKKLEEEKPKEIPIEKEVQEAVKEEEEKKLEKERIEKEKEFEEVEEEKKEQAKPEDDVDKKVNVMVEQTKKFAEGKEETAADILKEVKNEAAEEEKEEPEGQKEETEKAPTAHDLKKQKESKEDKKNKEQKEVEELTKELIKKGTLRKK